MMIKEDTTIGMQMRYYFYNFYPVYSNLSCEGVRYIVSIFSDFVQKLKSLDLKNDLALKKKAIVELMQIAVVPN